MNSQLVPAQCCVAIPLSRSCCLGRITACLILGDEGAALLIDVCLTCGRSDMERDMRLLAVFVNDTTNVLCFLLGILQREDCVVPGVFVRL